MSNLPYGATERLLSAHFAPCGAVTEVRIVMGRETAYSQSFAFVTMQTDDAAAQAVRKLDGTSLDGRVLRVSPVHGRALSGHNDRPVPRAPAISAKPVVPARAERRAEDVTPGDRRSERRERDAANAKDQVKITQQFRERHNMTYEVDCSGVRLIVRIFFPVGDTSATEWRIEARTSDACDAPVAIAKARSRAQAFQQIVEGWHETMPPTPSKLDWNGIAQAMASVRAL